jgi:acetoin:2,6-dichlorophenolindophenol oxidoreductase subunit alpha
VLTREQIDAVWTELREDIADAIKFAEDSPLPNPDQILTDVYTLDSTPDSKLEAVR